MSPVLSRLSHLSWLVLPAFMLFAGVFGFYFYQQETTVLWLKELWWVSYPSLGIAAAIAWQFGRSRLVYACLLVLILNVESNNAALTLSPELSDNRFNALLLCFLYLLYSKDKGFSLVNLGASLLIFSGIFLCAWLIFPHLQILSQNILVHINTGLYQLAPAVLSFVSPFQATLCLIAFLAACLRLIVKIDHTHNALFFGLITTVFMQLLSSSDVSLLGSLLLSALFCFAVVKDSFTMAYKDELTGIPSRRALMQYVQTLGRKYTVVMSDIDHFKKFNDSYGHDVGDEVLKLVASKLAKVMGGGKTFRFGGEEFIMVFPRKSPSEVLPYVELVRQTIADYDIALRAKPRPPKPKKPISKKAAAKKPTKDKIVKVTSSFGIAQRTKEHADFASIMKQADIALYAAKKAGRNCTKVAKQ